MGSKVKYLSFAITQSVVNIFITEISHADKGAMDMKHIKQDFSSNSWVDSVRDRGQNSIFFQSMVMLHIKLKRMMNAATCKHIFCPYIHPQPLGLGWGQRSNIFFFLKVVMLHIKLKEMECRAPCKRIFCPYTHS